MFCEYSRSPRFQRKRDRPIPNQERTIEKAGESSVRRLLSQIRNPKSEALNKSKELILQFQNGLMNISNNWFGTFDILSFEIV